MNPDEIINEYDSIFSDLTNLKTELEIAIVEFIRVFSFNNIDKVVVRIKEKKSYLEKAMKKDADVLKYNNPIKEIQDIIGARIVCFYRENVDLICKKVTNYFREIEEKAIVSDSPRDFGYEGKHFILFIPPTIRNKYTNLKIPIFFELQILTLFQHAWATGEHGIGYKPGMEISKLTARKLAFLSAQSWGADQILEELYEKKLNGENI